MNDNERSWWESNDEWMVPLIGGIGWGAQSYASSQLHSSGSTPANFNPFANNSGQQLQLPEIRTRVNFQAWIPIVAVIAIVLYFFKK